MPREAALRLLHWPERLFDAYAETKLGVRIAGAERYRLFDARFKSQAVRGIRTRTAPGRHLALGIDTDVGHCGVVTGSVGHRRVGETAAAVVGENDVVRGVRQRCEGVREVARNRAISERHWTASGAYVQLQIGWNRIADGHHIRVHRTQAGIADGDGVEHLRARNVLGVGRAVDRVADHRDGFHV